MAFTNQVADINAGFGPAVSPAGSNGFGTRVFWIAAVPDSDVTVNLGAGTAELHVRDLYEVEYPDFATSDGPNWQTAYKDASVSFDVVWNGPISRRVDVKDAADGFAGHFNENLATMTWTSHDASGYSFTSEVGNKATSDSFSGAGNFFAQLAEERNGVFFPAGAKAAGSGSLLVSALGGGSHSAGTASGGNSGHDGHENDVFRNVTAVVAHGGAAQPTQSATTGTQSSQALDQVFADLDGSKLADALNGNDLPSWAR
jgi:hypothetical protein